MEMFLSALQKGDEKAFRLLFDEFYIALCLFAERFLKDREAAADVVQESFLKYWDRPADISLCSGSSRMFESTPEQASEGGDRGRYGNRIG